MSLMQEKLTVDNASKGAAKEIQRIRDAITEQVRVACALCVDVRLCVCVCVRVLGTSVSTRKRTRAHAAH